MAKRNNDYFYTPILLSMRKVLLFFRGLKLLIICTIKILLTKDLFKQSKYINFYAKKVFEIFSIPVEIRGLENLKDLPPCIIVSNHFSSLDIPLILGFIPRNIRMVAKAELLKVPLIGWMIKRAKFVPIHRKEFKKAVEELKVAEWLFENGFDLYMAPEGTRSLDGTVKEFKKGPFVLSIKHKVPILPVTIINTNFAMPKRYIMPREKVPVGMVIHKAVLSDEYNYDMRDLLKEKVRNIIISGFEEIKIGGQNEGN